MKKIYKITKNNDTFPKPFQTKCDEITSHPSFILGCVHRSTPESIHKNIVLPICICDCAYRPSYTVHTDIRGQWSEYKHTVRNREQVRVYWFGFFGNAPIYPNSSSCCPHRFHHLSRKVATIRMTDLFWFASVPSVHRGPAIAALSAIILHTLAK